MKITYRRPLMVFFLIVFLLVCNTNVAYAANTPADSIDQFNEAVMRWYRLFLNSIVFPCEILSFAYCGIQLLFTGFLSAPHALDKVKTQIIMTVLALIVFMLLPTIIGWGVSIFRDTGWQPPNYDGYHGPSFEFK